MVFFSVISMLKKGSAYLKGLLSEHISTAVGVFLTKLQCKKGFYFWGCFFGVITFPSTKPATRTMRVPRMPARRVEIYGFAIAAIV